MNSGIYMIVNVNNGKMYIGSTNNFKSRRYEHFRKLRKGTNHCVKLQKSYNKYGEKNFMFRELVRCPSSYLFKLEQWFISTMKPELNIMTVVDKIGGFTHSEETKKKLSNNQFKGVTGAANPFSRRCYQYKLDGSFIKEWGSVSEAAKSLDNSDSLIVRCLKGRTKTAHRFQWFYEYKGIRVLQRVVKQKKETVKRIKQGT